MGEKPESMPGMQNLCSLLGALVSQKEKEYVSQQTQNEKRHDENSMSPVSTRRSSNGSISISDALASEEETASWSADDIMPTTPGRSALNLVDCNPTNLQAPTPPRENTVAAPPGLQMNAFVTQAAKPADRVKCQSEMPNHLRAIQMQQAAHAVQWQRASMAYASQMAAQYQMAAAYSAQATRYQQAARLHAAISRHSVSLRRADSSQ